ncbi:MAG TPA: polysaccharide deacetylase family protein [Candidatus Angelobacter sp.]|nr:polysaccharide deacetylase family protein [Candidatus Angelobacter sp.]
MPAKQNAVLAYHEVMPESNYAYCVTSSAFAEHLRLLDAAAKDGQPVATITFDDGEQSQLHNALPLLAEHCFSARYFVTPGLIGTAAKFLGWDELKTLQKAGHSIQSHGWSHKFLTLCSDDELAHELGVSKQELEQKLGAAVHEISVPGGRWNRRVIEAAATAGYKRVYLSDPWIVTTMYGLEVIGRFMVRRTTTNAELYKIVQRDRSALWKMKIRSQVRQGIVGLMGDDLYHRLWCRLTGYNEFETARQQNNHY